MITARQMAAKLGGISRQRVAKLAKQGRISGAQLVGGHTWIFPEDAKVLPPERERKKLQT